MKISLTKVLLSPLARARSFRRDDSAQVMLISGFMVFLIVVFAVSTLNSSQAVYRRTRLQIAADAAADAAAVWQARGINLIQTLNNLHYYLNASLYLPEIVTCCCCITLIPSCAGCAASLGLCGVCCAICEKCAVLCPKCSKVDNFQEKAANLIMDAEYAAARATTIKIFIEADRYAKLNGAEPFFFKGFAPGAAFSYVFDSENVLNPEYLGVMRVFPLHSFLLKSINPMNMYSLQSNPLKIPLFTTLGSPLHAVLVLKAPNEYERVWVNIVNAKATEEEGKADAFLLGYKQKEPGTFDFPWDLSKTFITICSLGAGDGWSDPYWERYGAPTMTWMVAMEKKKGGIIDFEPQGGPKDVPTGMYHYLNPSGRRKLALPPHIAVASSTSHGKMEDASLFSSWGKAEAKGTLVPVQLGGDTFTTESIEAGIFH